MSTALNSSLPCEVVIAMSCRSYPASNLKALPTHLRCLAVLTAAACGGCDAFRTGNTLLQHYSDQTICQHRLHSSSKRPNPSNSCMHYKRDHAIVGKRRRRCHGSARMTAAAHGDRERATATEDSFMDNVDVKVLPAAIDAQGGPTTWFGNGPDPMAATQLSRSAFAAQATAERRASIQPDDHPNLEVWMNGPFQAPRPVGSLDILHLDDDIVVVNKPSGLLCVPGRIEKDSLATRVALELGHYRVDKMVVHRLDMATSGVVVMARSDAALKSLHQQFRARVVDKSYVAMVHGVLSAEEGEVDLPVCRNRACPPLHMINVELGKPSLTKWRVVGRLADRTRVALIPVSGRSHQLRLHMDAIGHPILGDHFYGNKESLALADRCLLHAETLSINHPVTRERLTFTAPSDF